MVTSPPYNVGKEYDSNLTLSEYRTFLKKYGVKLREYSFMAEEHVLILLI